MHVPNKTLISWASPALQNQRSLTGSTVHSKLASFLARKYEDPEVWYRLWQDVWPKKEEFETVIPLLWREEAQKCLSRSAQGTSHGTLANYAVWFA